MKREEGLAFSSRVLRTPSISSLDESGGFTRCGGGGIGIGGARHLVPIMLCRRDVKRLQADSGDVGGSEHHCVGRAPQLETVRQEFLVIEIPVMDILTSTDHSAMTRSSGAASIHKVYTNTALFSTKTMSERR